MKLNEEKYMALRANILHKLEASRRELNALDARFTEDIREYQDGVTVTLAYGKHKGAKGAITGARLEDFEVVYRVLFTAIRINGEGQKVTLTFPADMLTPLRKGVKHA